MRRTFVFSLTVIASVATLIKHVWHKLKSDLHQVPRQVNFRQALNRYKSPLKLINRSKTVYLVQIILWA